MGKMIRGQAGEGLSTSVQQGKISGVSYMLSGFSRNSALSLSTQLSLRVANHPPSQPLSSKDKLALSTFVPGHSKHPLPTTQEKTLHMDITKWSIPKSN